MRKKREPQLNTLDKKVKSPDWWILFSTMLLVCIGIIMVFSSSQYFTQYSYGDSFYYLKRQLVNAGVGLAAMLIAYLVNYKFYKACAWYIYGSVLFILVLLLFGGNSVESQGAVRWIDLGFTTFQPSELAKVAMVIVMAAFFSTRPKAAKSFKYGFLPSLLLMALTCVMVYLQNDLGTALVIAAAGMVMMFCGGVRLPYLLGTGVLGAAAAGAAIFFTGFRMERIYAYLDPWADPTDAGFQTVQSLLAIGSGGLTGVGLGAGGSKWYYLPARHTDFIFSVLCEELGFIGGLLVIALFVILIWRGLMVAVNAPDTFASLLALGLVAIIGFQAFINLGVVTGLLPITGITLPFVSYGGTSLIVSMASVGILLNISRYSEIRR